MMRVLLVSLAYALLVPACSEQCDPDQTLSAHLCIPNPRSDGSAADASTGDAPGAEARGPKTCDGAPTDFGESCAATNECGCGTDLCAKNPGSARGFCTKMGCASDPRVCPAGYSCFDANAFSPGLSLCVKM